MLKYLVVILFLPACTAGRMSGENCTTITRGQFPALATPDSVSWSIVDFREISNHCFREELIYSGSFRDYHLISWNDSDSDYDHAEHRFAVLRGTFTPLNPFEYAATGRMGEQRVFR